MPGSGTGASEVDLAELWRAKQHLIQIIPHDYSAPSSNFSHADERFSLSLAFQQFPWTSINMTQEFGCQAAEIGIGISKPRSPRGSAQYMAGIYELRC